MKAMYYSLYNLYFLLFMTVFIFEYLLFIYFPTQIYIFSQ